MLDPNQMSAASPPPSTPSVQQVSFPLFAPTGWRWWVLSVVYLSAFAMPGHAILGVLALVAFMSALREPFPAARALWLWVVGIASATAVLCILPSWKPNGLSLAQWFSQNPAAASTAAAIGLLSAFVLIWHLTWIRRLDHAATFCGSASVFGVGRVR